MSLLSKREFTIEATLATDVITPGLPVDFAIKVDNSKCS